MNSIQEWEQARLNLEEAGDEDKISWIKHIAPVLRAGEKMRKDLIVQRDSSSLLKEALENDGRPI